MDPGRKRHETREAPYVLVGDTVVLGSGVLWAVESFDATPSGTLLHLSRRHGDRLITDTHLVNHGSLVTVRNTLTATS